MNAKKFILDASRKIGVVVSRRKASALRSAFRRVCGTTTRDFMLVVLPLVLDRFFFMGMTTTRERGRGGTTLRHELDNDDDDFDDAFFLCTTSIKTT